MIGRRRRERQIALESLISCSTAEPAITPPTLNPLASSLNHSSDPSDPSDTNDTTPSTGSDVLPELSNDPLRTQDLFDFNADVSSSDTYWATPEQATTELNNFLQTDDVVNATFADDFQIAVPELDLLRAAYENAGRMRSAHLLFDMNAESVFLTSDCSSWIAALPKNLQPTLAQLTISHHPVIDILPWPAVRTKFINMYSLPSDLWPRHPVDGAASSLVRMVYDMEDGGVLVSGQDPSKESAWEIEQRFFNAWWWGLDQRVVSISNQKRIARGLPKLRGS